MTGTTEGSLAGFPDSDVDSDVVADVVQLGDGSDLADLAVPATVPLAVAPAAESTGGGMPLARSSRRGVRPAPRRGAGARPTLGSAGARAGARGPLGSACHPALGPVWTFEPYPGARPATRWAAAAPSALASASDGGSIEPAVEQARRAGRPLVLGLGSDPYPQIERQRRRTRALLEGLAAGPHTPPLLVITRSPLIVRDRELLLALQQRGGAQVLLALPATDPELVRELEPDGAAPAERLEALAALERAGLRCGLFAAPLLPGPSCSTRALRRLACAAKEAGAELFDARVLALGPRERTALLEWASRARPEWEEALRRAYGARGRGAARIAEQVANALVALRAQYRLGGLTRDGLEASPLPRGPRQLELFDPVLAAGPLSEGPIGEPHAGGARAPRGAA